MTPHQPKGAQAGSANGQVMMCQFEQTGHRDTQNLSPELDEGAVPRYLKQKTFKNYRELLAKERAETERMFFIKVLARKEAENRRRSQRAGNNG